MKIRVEQTVFVEIDIQSGSDAVTRVTGPGGNEWRQGLYPLYDMDDVLHMWADNAIRNGVRDANRLDGWGDLPDGDVSMTVTHSSFESSTVLGPSN